MIIASNVCVSLSIKLILSAIFCDHFAVLCYGWRLNVCTASCSNEINCKLYMTSKVGAVFRSNHIISLNTEFAIESEFSLPPNSEQQLSNIKTNKNSTMAEKLMTIKLKQLHQKVYCFLLHIQHIRCFVVCECVCVCLWCMCFLPLSRGRSALVVHINEWLHPCKVTNNRYRLYANELPKHSQPLFHVSSNFLGHVVSEARVECQLMLLFAARHRQRRCFDGIS